MSYHIDLEKQESLPICEFCKTENASWLSASVHADCLNIGDGTNVNPIEERECGCDCQYGGRKN